MYVRWLVGPLQTAVPRDAPGPLLDLGCCLSAIAKPDRSFLIDPLDLQAPQDLHCNPTVEYRYKVLVGGLIERSR